MACTPKRFRRAHRLMAASKRAEAHWRGIIGQTVGSLMILREAMDRVFAAASLVIDGVCEPEEMGTAWTEPIATATDLFSTAKTRHGYFGGEVRRFAKKSERLQRKSARLLKPAGQR